MPKRSRYKRESSQSKALKKFRLKANITQRELASLLNVPQTKVAHTENGRAYIRKPYIEKFIKVLNLSWKEWDLEVGKDSTDIELREECKMLIERISDDKLRVLHSLLVNF